MTSSEKPQWQKIAGSIVHYVTALIYLAFLVAFIRGCLNYFR